MGAGESPKRAIRTILIVALGGFLMGFDGSLFTGAIPFVRDQFDLSTFGLGWANASHTFAATIAIFLAGPIADRVGRRTVLRAAGIAFVFSSVVAAAAHNMLELIVGRMLSGFGVGAVLVAGPMYIAEISQPAMRGRMVTFNQLFIVIGIALASINNLAILNLEGFHFSWLAALHLADWNWRWMLGIGALPALVYLFALLWVPESPRWLAMHSGLDAARRVLVRAHGEELAESELAEIRASLSHQTSRRDATLRDLWVPGLRVVLLIGLLVGVFQQATGISSVLAYAPVIFESVGATASAPFMQTVYVTLVNLVFTVLAMLLIDRVGRRPLLLFGMAGMGACLALTAYGFKGAGGALNPTLVLTGLLGFVASFAVSIGPVMWVLLSEIFPNRVRAVAISCVGLVNSTVCFLVQLVFPWQMEKFGGATTFLIYGVFALVGLLLMAKMLPETRGRSLEELEAIEEPSVRHG
jgi:SP family arabinose:H+ symporter-like MFS transporter